MLYTTYMTVYAYSAEGYAFIVIEFVFCLPLYLIVPNVDFNLMRSTLRFGACQKRNCVDVTIINDTVLENTETFTVNLQKPPYLGNEFTVDPSSEVVAIVDDDGT